MDKNSDWCPGISECAKLWAVDERDLSEDERAKIRVRVCHECMLEEYREREDIK